MACLLSAIVLRAVQFDIDAMSASAQLGGSKKARRARAQEQAVTDDFARYREREGACGGVRRRREKRVGGRSASAIGRSTPDVHQPNVSVSGSSLRSGGDDGGRLSSAVGRHLHAMDNIPSRIRISFV